MSVCTGEGGGGGETMFCIITAFMTTSIQLKFDSTEFLLLKLKTFIQNYTKGQFRPTSGGLFKVCRQN